MNNLIKSLLLLLLSGLLVCSSCSIQTQTRKVFTPQEFPEKVKSVDGKSPFLKAHMLNGWSYVLKNWKVNEEARNVSGTGKLFDTDRKVVQEGEFVIPLDSVALFETNVIHASPSIAVLSVVTAGSIALSIYCITNPKSCFGSCPTFYASVGEKELLVAEGFSASVAPALEATDIDALYRVKSPGPEFELKLTNEALETHVIRFANLLVAPKPDAGRVLITPSGEFVQVPELIPPLSCTSPEGECLAQILKFDGSERYSTTDSNDLATKETLDLEFENVPETEIGLVIASRQSLLSTYLFYQSLAYMGNKAGEWLALLNRGKMFSKERASAIGKKLGGIEVLRQDEEGNWVSIKSIHETGPLAADVRLVPLGRATTDHLKLRLRLTKGHWRLDWLALAKLGPTVKPIRIQPFEVKRNQLTDKQALRVLLDSSKVLATFPGDEYTLKYKLPRDYMNYELFLESRGYYLEWMREEWLKEENQTQAIRMFNDPEGVLKELAPEFKKIEPEIEKQFWSSKYVSE